jgi:hypothetical protein
MISKYNLATISPDVDGATFNAATGGTDIVFDWTPMLIPNGSCVIKSISGTIMGTNGGVQTDSDFRLYFAKSIKGVAPSSFGTAHAGQGVNQAAAFRRNILGAIHVDMGASDDADNLTAYHVLQSKLANASSTAGELRRDIMLQGEANVTTIGYQTIYVAMELVGAAYDFGTDVDLNMAGHQAASTAAAQITVSGTDARLVFQAGDSIVGETGTVEAEIVSVDSDVLMTVKNISAQIDHQEQLIHKNPITLNFGCEY